MLQVVEDYIDPSFEIWRISPRHRQDALERHEEQTGQRVRICACVQKSFATGSGQFSTEGRLDLIETNIESLSDLGMMIR